MTTMIDNLTRQLRGDEGSRKTVYADSRGFLTIGVGRLVDSRRPGSGLRDSEIELLLANDVADRQVALRAALPWFQGLDDARQGVLLNMAFQLGTAGLLDFRKMLAALQVGNFEAAADEMADSDWAKKQTPVRAARLVKQMRSGAWQFAMGA